MKKQYLTLSNGQKFRIESNWNSLVDYCEAKGYTNLSHLEKIADIQLRDISSLIYACVKEGERMDGNEMRISELDFSAKLNPANIQEFMKIYAAQTQANLPGSNHKAKKKMFQKKPN